MLSKKFLYITSILIVQCYYTHSTELQKNDTSDIYKTVNLKNEEFLTITIIPDITYLTSTRQQLQQHENFFETLDTFLLLWNVFKDKHYEVTKDIPFTIIIPKVDAKNIIEERLEEFLLEHIVPGVAVNSFSEDDFYGNLNKNRIHFKQMPGSKESVWTINLVKILRTERVKDNLSVIYIDGYLGDRKNAFSKRNIQEKNSYNEPQRLEMKNVTKHDNTPIKENKISHLMNFLSGMKSGTKVFQHFLSKSNLTQILDDNSYTVLIPSDSAFQRWHPIDWGFYPFSVQEFTENVLRNHVLQMKNPLRLIDVRNMDKEHKYKTLGGETVVIRSRPNPNVNNATILSDFTLPNGNEVFLISEVLFVSEAVVSRLHSMHKDKETPPLLAFPWFGAQFLSHSFLALERDNRFTQITRYLNTAEIAPYVSGSNYTFFVPNDLAFEKLRFDLLSDDILGSEKGVKMLLNHFVKGRLYDRDLKDHEVFETLGGEAVKIQRVFRNVTVNNANIIESEIFVYNLGTMFYIDDILYSDILKDEILTPPPINERTTISSFNSNQNDYKYSTAPDVEIVPSEYIEPSGNDDDFLLQDDEIVTPRALPVKYEYYSPK